MAAGISRKHAVTRTVTQKPLPRTSLEPACFAQADVIRQRREARALARLAHPNIVAVYDELTPSKKTFHRVIILLPVATNQLKAHDIESTARRTTVFGSDQRESAQDSQGLACLFMESARPGRFVSGNPVQIWRALPGLKDNTYANT